jgi:hypothetical protein
MEPDALVAEVPEAAEVGMIRVEQKRAALVVMLNAWKSYGDRAFKVSPYSPNWKPLCTAEQLGWVTWIGDRCKLTPAGIEQLLPYGAKIREPAQ